MDQSNQTLRAWGKYSVLYNAKGCKVKELYVEPQSSLSMQRHKLRNELWLVVSGQCILYSKLSGGYNLPPKNLQLHDYIVIEKNSWHQLSNPFNTACKLIEIQFGDDCYEDDIERQ